FRKYGALWRQSPAGVQRSYRAASRGFRILEGSRPPILGIRCGVLSMELRPALLRLLWLILPYYSARPTRPALNRRSSIYIRRLGSKIAVCEISQRYSGIAQRGSSEVIHWIRSNRARFTGRE